MSFGVQRQTQWISQRLSNHLAQRARELSVVIQRFASCITGVLFWLASRPAAPVRNRDAPTRRGRTPLRTALGHFDTVGNLTTSSHTQHQQSWPLHSALTSQNLYRFAQRVPALP